MAGDGRIKVFSHDRSYSSGSFWASCQSCYLGIGFDLAFWYLADDLLYFLSKCHIRLLLHTFHKHVFDRLHRKVLGRNHIDVLELGPFRVIHILGLGRFLGGEIFLRSFLGICIHA